MLCVYAKEQLIFSYHSNAAFTAASTSQLCKAVGLFPAELALSLGVICRVTLQQLLGVEKLKRQKDCSLYNQGLLPAFKEGKGRETKKIVLWMILEENYYFCSCLKCHCTYKWVSPAFEKLKMQHRLLPNKRQPSSSKSLEFCNSVFHLMMLLEVFQELSDLNPAIVLN